MRPTTFIGIDMSASSPGLCIVDELRETITTYFFRQRVKRSERSGQMLLSNPRSQFSGWTYRSICLDSTQELMPTDGCLARFSRYKMRVCKIMAVICSKAPCRLTSVVAVEHYAYKMSNSSSQSVLMELGGCLRLLLHSYGYAVREISPSAIKKHFSGSGKARKEDMFRAALDRHHLPDVAAIIGVQVEGLARIPNPVEDIVDAIATALTLMHQCSSETPRSAAKPGSVAKPRSFAKPRSVGKSSDM